MTREHAERQKALVLEDIDLAEMRLRFTESEPKRLAIKRHIANRKEFYRALQAEPDVELTEEGSVIAFALEPIRNQKIAMVRR